MKRKKIITVIVIAMAFCQLFMAPSEVGAKARSWYFMKNSTHKQPAGAVSASYLKKYNAFYLKPTKEKVIYLTFDCGYENGYTRKILKTLKKHDAKATFFVTKTYVQSSAKICKQMKKEGHMVGNHTITHPNMTTKTNTQLKKEMEGCANYFKTKTGYDMDKYLRPPMGCFSERTLKYTKKLGYTSIFWSMAYYDYDTSKQPGKQYVINYFQKYYHKGAIPLIHVVSSSNCNALDTVLTNLEKKGYRFGTLDEL